MTGKFENTVRTYESRLEKDLSISDVQACGIWGNVGGETGGLNLLQETNPTVKGSQGGYGWLQWTGPRRRQYLAWCTQHNLKPESDEANYQYLVYETKNLETHSLEQLRKTTTVASATETFMLQNLRPGIPNLQGRINWANKAYSYIKSLIITPPAKVDIPVKKDTQDTLVVVSSKGSPRATTGGIFAILTAFLASMFTDHIALLIGLSVGAFIIGYIIHKAIEYRKITK